MNKKALRKYLRRINKALCCSAESRRRLLDGFQQELADQELAALSYEQLSSRFGTPDVLAASLMEAVDPEEIAKESKRRKIRPFIFVSVITLVLVLVFAAYVWYVSQHAIDYAVDTITITEYSASTK